MSLHSEFTVLGGFVVVVFSTFWFVCRPDITILVDWAKNIKLLTYSYCM